MAELDDIINEPSESEKRIKQLSSKVREEAEAREAEKTAREKAEQEAAEAKKNAEFADSFADMVATNPAAKEHKDEIKSKVLAGYTVEDAVFSVLHKAGKLTPPTPPEPESPAGGSAPTGTPEHAPPKSVSEMTQEERRAALMERESELLDILSPRQP